MSHKLSILLIEDDPDDALLIEDMLAEVAPTGPGDLAFDLEWADRLSAGLEHLATRGTDVVLLDLFLPDTQALDAFTQVHTQASQVPIIVLSSLADEKLAIEALRQGAQDYLLKGQVDGHLLTRAMRYAIERQRTEETLRQRNRQLGLLHRASQTFISSLNLDQVLNTALEEVRHLLGVTSSSIWLKDPETGELVCEQITGPHTETLRGWRLAPTEGIVGWAARSNESVIVSDTRADERHFKGVDRQTGVDMRSILCVPLRVRQDIIGVLELVDTQVERFQAADLALIEPLAATAAIAIENARLYQEADRLRAFNENIVQSMDEGVLLYDPSGMITFVNPRLAQMVNYAPEELIGRHWRDLVAPEQMHKVEEEAAKRPCGIAGRYEAVALTRDGQRVPVIVSSCPLFDEGRFSNTLVVCTDITERVQAEAERERLLAQIQEQAQQVQQIIDTVPEGVLLLNADLCIQMANPAARRALAALIGKEIGEPLTHLGPVPLVEVLGRHSDPLPVEIVLPEPSRCLFEAQAQPIGDDKSRQWVLTLREVTQEREIQRQMQVQERLATVGQLAAGIAHDFNNIMASIVLYAGMLLRSSNLSPRDRQRLDTIRQQGRRAANLVQQILDFARRSVMERKPLDLVPFLKELEKLLVRTLPENIHIYLDYGHEDYIVNADATRIQQVVMNLALNARDAMPEGGELRFTLERFTLRPGQTGPLLDMPSGQWIRLTVTDTGIGIPPDVLPHVFEPFFTTKEVGKGTGLGLAQVWGIVLQHEGKISVESQGGYGTTFTIYLPALELPEAVPEAPATPDLVKGLGETILVVEDDATTREAISEILEDLGYRVLTAANGQEALKVFDSEIALVLSDLVMPEMGGAALHTLLKEKHPKVKLIVATGYPLTDGGRALLEQGVTAWIPKPFSADEIARAVREALK